MGIPVGRQCFKLAALWFCPFGRDVEAGGGVPSFLMNVHLAAGQRPVAGPGRRASTAWLLCLTVVGIPFGLQCFKLARLSLSPFGARILCR